MSQDSTTGLSPSMAQVSAASFLKIFYTFVFGPITRNINVSFRLFPFRSPLLWESLLLSFPSATKMFQFEKKAKAIPKVAASGMGTA